MRIARPRLCGPYDRRESARCLREKPGHVVSSTFSFSFSLSLFFLSLSFSLFLYVFLPFPFLSFSFPPLSRCLSLSLPLSFSCILYLSLFEDYCERRTGVNKSATRGSHRDNDVFTAAEDDSPAKLTSGINECLAQNDTKRKNSRLNKSVIHIDTWYTMTTRDDSCTLRGINICFIKE